MKYLVDTQLPPRLAKHLSDKGVDAIHITSVENGHLFSDEKIRGIAIEQQRAIITNDADFFDYKWELIEQEFRENAHHSSLSTITVISF